MLSLTTAGGPAQSSENGKITGLEMIQCCTSFDKEGSIPAMRVQDFITGDDHLAIGQGGDPKPLQGQVDLDERGRLVFDRKTMSTSRPGFRLRDGHRPGRQSVNEKRPRGGAGILPIWRVKINGEALEEPAALESSIRPC